MLHTAARNLEVPTVMLRHNCAGTQSTCPQLTVCLQYHLERQDVEGFDTIVDDMLRSRLQLTSTIFCQRLQRCTLHDQLADAQAEADSLWARMKADKVPLTTDCYNAFLALKLLANPDCKRQSVEAVQEMRSRGLTVKTDTFNTIMTSCVKNADFLQVCCLTHALSVVLQCEQDDTA